MQFWEEINMEAREVYESWLNDPYYDEATKEELRAIEDNEQEITERFYTSLSFGTAGLRGIIGAGTNRMNKYTIQKATQGLANYIISQHKEGQGVAIAYDSRRMSVEFADEAALCLNGNGIKAYVFDSLRPTPVLSFAVRYFGCAAGINITASHNPAAYNGYKVYWEDGAQITPPHDTGIMKEVAAIADMKKVRILDKMKAVELGLYKVIGKDLDQAYQKEIIGQMYHKDLTLEQGKDVTIVYSPLHGTGNLPVRRALEEVGFTDVHVVPEQEKPDGEFPTVSYPNPETDEAFELGLALGQKLNADLILATDPDADRLGVRVVDKDGNYHPLTGNMSGALIEEYIMAQRKAAGTIPQDGKIVRSIVTTQLADAIAQNYGVELVEVLTGFKYIGLEILKYEQTGKGTYLFGMEESYGCLPGTYARDKDAVVASLLLCEAAVYYKTKGMTLWDAMIAMYEKYGYYLEDVIAVTMEGKDGIEKIKSIMARLQDQRVAQIGDYKVLARKNFVTGQVENYVTGETTQTGMPESNVLYYVLENNAWVCIRPSGTEPKIKVYMGVKGTSIEDGQRASKALKDEAEKLLK